ncbi:UNVERIFIED_CONTAM: Mitogen-activated protein kinase kinase kinase [Sesamum radiatum]|uniref:Mitogen-activated protein kinase kinase kinase n=1 Tax=Sesamum radiatum TaxID=300843 RepID=A0AAW2RDN2_SESRA
MDWVRGEKLGQGSFATVSLAVPRGRSSFLPPLMAVKSCGVSHSSSLVSERLVLEELGDCPEIIRCFGESFSYENGEKLYNVLLEYASGGSLADKLKKSGDRGLPESDVRQYTKSLLKGLRYIHKVGFVHCDIKLQNILLGPKRRRDCGFRAREAGCEEEAVPRCELRGTPMYMSPEMVAPANRGLRDIWALGCVGGGSPELRRGVLPTWGTVNERLEWVRSACDSRNSVRGRKRFSWEMLCQEPKQKMDG